MAALHSRVRPPATLRRPRLAAACLLGLLALLAGAPSAAGNGGSAVAVIVGKGQAPAAPVSATLLAGIFARKRQLWDDRTRIVPVNLPIDHPLRRQFSLAIFNRSPEGLRDYWSEQYFHGVLPPPVLGSEEAVLRFVATTPGAIGYVSACTADKRVDVVALIGGPDTGSPCVH